MALGCSPGRRRISALAGGAGPGGVTGALRALLAVLLSSDVSLQSGMVLSNEPGYYESGWGGIRLENLYVIKKAEGYQQHPAGKEWLCFETLTLIPFDRKLIDINNLSPYEIKWLDEYHHHVLREIKPLLDNPLDIQWLKLACGAD